MSVKAKPKIRCANCKKVIAKGDKPADVEIKCYNCGHLNDLSK